MPAVDVAEADLDLTGPRVVGDGLTGRADLPREHEPARWIPEQDAPPVAAETVRADLVAQPARAALHADLDQRARTRPRVFRRPPVAQPIGEGLEGALRSGRHGD